MNEYLFERIRGSVRPPDICNPAVRLKRLQREAAQQIGYSLCDFLTWLESEQAHPSVNIADWKDARAWHIGELYKDAMLAGYWTENFWQTRQPAPLAPETVERKVTEVLRCFRWCAFNDLISEFEEAPALWEIESARQAMLDFFEREASPPPVGGGIPRRHRRIREQPGSRLPPTVSHLKAFFSELQSNVRLPALQVFETGMRAEEIIENSLLPGRLHRRRQGEEAWSWHPSWPTSHYRLNYSLDDDRMLGVLPTREMAWDDGTYGYQCSYRILGKGPKIRLVHLAPKLLKSIWRYIDSTRDILQAEADLRGLDVSAYAYLNRFGDQLSYDALRQAFARANKRLNAPLSITPHLLRHAHACCFLETSILEQARRHGYGADDIPSALIHRYGETVLLVIQSQLGHAEFSTTQKYLAQLAHGRIGFTYRNAYNNWLDEFDELGDA